MNVVMWAPVATAAVSVAGAVVSSVMWLRARNERREAARHARAASEAQVAIAGSIARIAQLQDDQHKRELQHQSALERDPWRWKQVRGGADLINDSGTPKHGVTVEVLANDEPWDSFTFDYVGPGRSVFVDYTEVNGEMQAMIRWHLREDQTDDQLMQTCTW